MDKLIRRKNKNRGERDRSTERPTVPKSLKPYGGSKFFQYKFWFDVVLAQLVGFACIGLLIHWSNLYGGLQWAGDPTLQFFFHPALMVLGLVFFYGDAIIVFQVLSFLPRQAAKMVHALLHLGAIGCSIVGLVAVLEYHRRTSRPDFYSLHSWIGISTFGLFCSNHLLGFVAFIFPGFSGVWRSRVMPYHAFFGIGIFALAIASALTGLTEKLIWTAGYTDAKFNEQAIVGNLLGCGLIVFGLLIVFLITYPPYKRKLTS